MTADQPPDLSVLTPAPAAPVAPGATNTAPLALPDGPDSSGELRAAEAEDDCPHCSPTHERPESRPWGVYVAPDRLDGQPTHLVVQPSGGAHVAQSDADWLWQLIRDYQPGREDDVERAADALAAAGWRPPLPSEPQPPDSDHWQISTRVPLSVPVAERQELFDLVSVMVQAWETPDREAEVSGARADYLWTENQRLRKELGIADREAFVARQAAESARRDALPPLIDPSDECQSERCTRIEGRCVGYHCTVCGQPSSMLGLLDHAKCRDRGEGDKL